jgi:hypothetical protein
VGVTLFPAIYQEFWYLVEVENQIQLTHITEELIQNLNKEMNTFKICQLIVRDVHTHGEEETSIPTINHFMSPKLSSKYSSQNKYKFQNK